MMGEIAQKILTHPYVKYPVIIFMVQNASDHDIYLPAENTFGFISAAATSNDDKQTYVILSRGSSDSPISCRKLAPGATAFLHPDASSIDLKWKQGLPDGKYTVIISCRNAQPKAKSAQLGDDNPVIAWTGDLSAPPVTLELTTKPDH